MPSLLVQSFSSFSFFFVIVLWKTFLVFCRNYVCVCLGCLSSERGRSCLLSIFCFTCFILRLFSLRWRWSFSFMSSYLSSRSVPSFSLLKQIHYNEFYLTFTSPVAVAESIWKIMTANEYAFWIFGYYSLIFILFHSFWVLSCSIFCRSEKMTSLGYLLSFFFGKVVLISLFNCTLSNHLPFLSFWGIGFLFV